MGQNGTKRRRTILGLRRNGDTPPTPSRRDRPPPIERVSATYLRQLRREPAELARFLHSHEPLLIAVAKRLFRRHWAIVDLPGDPLKGDHERVVTMGDLIQAGQVGQLKALKSWKASRGVKWSTYATWKIRSEMQREILSSSDDAMRLPAHVRDTRHRLVNTPPEVRDEAQLHQVERTIRRVSYPMRLDHPVGRDGDELRDVLAGPPDDHSHIHAGERAEIIRAALVRIAGDRPYRDPPTTYAEQVAAAIWSEPRPIEFEEVADLVAERYRRVFGGFARRIRYGIDQAQKEGWVEVHQNGAAQSYGQAGPPRPSADHVRNVQIMAWRIGVAEPIGRTRTLKDIGDDHGLSRERVRQIQLEWMPLLRAELEAVA